MVKTSLIPDAPEKRPVPFMSTWTTVEMQTWLHTEVQCFLNNVLKQNEVAERVNELAIAHREAFFCRNNGCFFEFPLHSSRIR